MKKILVLGASGQDGSLISKFLLKKNFRVFGMVRKSATGNLKNLIGIINDPNFKLCHGDLLDVFSLETIIKVIYLFFSLVILKSLSNLFLISLLSFS